MKRLNVMKNFILCILVALLAACSSTPSKSTTVPAVTKTSTAKEKEQEASFCTGVLYVAANWLAGVSRFNDAEEVMYIAEVFYSVIEDNQHAESEAKRAAELSRTYLYSSKESDIVDFENSVNMCIDTYNRDFVK